MDCGPRIADCELRIADWTATAARGGLGQLSYLGPPAFSVQAAFKTSGDVKAAWLERIPARRDALPPLDREERLWGSQPGRSERP